MMHLYLSRRIKYLFRKYDWISIIVVLLILHCISAGLLLFFDYGAFAEETISKTLWKGTWWFFVTATTVGYGDIVPTTIPGQIIAVFDMIFGIGLMYTIIGAGADKVIERRRRRMRGLSQLNLHEHIALLGGGAERKMRNLIKEIQSDPLYKGVELVVCSDHYDENPFNDDVEFVRGRIGDDDTLTRACVEQAKVVIIYGISDEETILTALAVDEINRSAFTTVYIRDRVNIKHIQRINKVRHAGIAGKRYGRIRVITRINDLMLAREISNPDLSEAILQLMNRKTGNTFYSIEAWPEHDCALQLPAVRQMLRATDAHALLVGVRRFEDGSICTNPPEDLEVNSNDHLFVIAAHRPVIEWTPLLETAQRTDIRHP